ncbi:MAG: Hsp20/alpha crystallin family protein [Fimbriimonadales bacterium]
MRPVPHPDSKDPLFSALGRLVGASRPLAEDSQVWEALFDVKETPKEITVLIDLPGVDEDEIDIDVKNDSLQVTAGREFDHDTEDAEEYTKLGRPYGVFGCSISLPKNADPDGMTAKYKRGVLKVRIPFRHALC